MDINVYAKLANDCTTKNTARIIEIGSYSASKNTARIIEAGYYSATKNTIRITQIK